MILPQNSDYTVISNNEAASIICRFTPEMIDDIVEEAIQNKYRDYSMTLANIVESIETNYKMAIAGIPEYSTEIVSQRYNIYRQIINKVCYAHQLIYNGAENGDIYSDANLLYDFLIARFNLYLVQFFVNYINREKAMIYETLELASKKKDASAYSKKLYKSNNSKLAVIHANLEFVLQNICNYDIDFEMYTELACIPDRMRSKYLQSILLDQGDFFKRIIVPYFNIHYAQLVTQIKFTLQGLSVAEFSDLA